MTFPTSTTSCKWGFLTQNHIKYFGKCALNINALEALMKIAMNKIAMDSFDFRL